MPGSSFGPGRHRPLSASGIQPGRRGADGLAGDGIVYPLYRRAAGTSPGLVAAAWWGRLSRPRAVERYAGTAGLAAW